jgi:hypothetical protein
MSDDRVPVEGFTIDREPRDGTDQHWVRWPCGLILMSLSPPNLAAYGLPVPTPPRVGPLGLSEGDTRWVAGPSSSVASVTITAKDDESRVRAHLIVACRAAVAEWDGESGATS